MTYGNRSAVRIVEQACHQKFHVVGGHGSGSFSIITVAVGSWAICGRDIGTSILHLLLGSRVLFLGGHLSFAEEGLGCIGEIDLSNHQMLAHQILISCDG